MINLLNQLKIYNNIVIDNSSFTNYGLNACKCYIQSAILTGYKEYMMDNKTKNLINISKNICDDYLKTNIKTTYYMIHS